MGDAETEIIVPVPPLPDGRIPLDEPQEQEKIMARDPVCGMDVDPAEAAAMTEYRGVAYYFCSTVCRDEFDSDPHRYIG